MKRSFRIIHLIIYIQLFLLAACNVHEWPKEDESVPLLLQLRFATAWSEQDHYYTRGTRGERGTVTRGEMRTGVEARALGEYDMRYTIRAYPVDAEGNVSQTPAREFVFTRSVIVDYDYATAEVSLPAGTYCLMAWADFVVPGTADDLYYNPADFSRIVYSGTHTANTDYRDAFRGSKEVTLQATIHEEEPPTVIIDMERPMAKFTFVSNDLKEFIAKEETRHNRSTKADETKSSDTKGGDTRNVDLNDYRVLFIYSGYMPDTYDMFNDRPVGVAVPQSVQFQSKLAQINEAEASMGFDYVMVNGGDASVELTVGLFDAGGNQISMSDPIIVPLKRSVNTIMRGSFMMMEANGGVGINPDFYDDYIIVIP